MSLVDYLFSFSGRINRAKQWAVLLVSFAHYTTLGIVFAFTIGFSAVVALVQHQTTIAAVATTPQARSFGIVFCVLFVIGFYISLAIAAKRLHDRDRSAWWLLLLVILPLALNVPAFLYLPTQFAYSSAVMQAIQAHTQPPPQPLEPPLVILSRGAATILSLWAFVELYILRGTVGDNRYGPDPLAGKGTA